MPAGQDRRFGSLTLRFADGGRETIASTREEYERAVAAVDAGEAVEVRQFAPASNKESGAFHAAAGAVVAVSFHT